MNVSARARHSYISAESWFASGIISLSPHWGDAAAYFNEGWRPPVASYFNWIAVERERRERGRQRRRRRNKLLQLAICHTSSTHTRSARERFMRDVSARLSCRLFLPLSTNGWRFSRTTVINKLSLYNNFSLSLSLTFAWLSFRVCVFYIYIVGPVWEREIISTARYTREKRRQRSSVALIKWRRAADLVYG